MQIFKESFDLIRNTWRLNKMFWKEKSGLLLSYNFIILISSFTPFLESGAMALVINELMRIGKSGQASPDLFYYVGAVGLFVFLAAILWKIENYIDLLYYLFIEQKIELLTIKKYAEIDVALYENPKYKDLFNKITEDGTYRVCNFADSQFYVIKGFVEVAIASSILAYINWQVFLFLFIGTIPELVVSMYYGKRVWTIHTSKAEVRRRFWDTKGHFSRLPSLIELKLFQNTEHFYNIIKDLFLNFRKEEYKNNWRNFVHQIISSIISQGVLVGAIIFYIFEVVEGSMELGTLTFVIASIRQLRGSLSGLFRIVGKQFQDSLFVTDLFEFLDIRPVVRKAEKGIKIDHSVPPEIIFDNVSFSYPNTDKLVLKNFSVVITPGKKVALVGLNGAGKTTFVKLLCRFYDPTGGRIFINGHDLRDVDLGSWYYTVGAVFQDYSRYHFSVKEAIAIGRTGKKTDLQKVMDAAKSSEADVFIEKWEKAYEQNLGVEFTEGVEPSIGQWQKLALARTFYRDPKMMILDEPTSSIDAESEAKIFDRIEEIVDDRTVILISHRFSTVKKANKIVIIKNGEKAEEGTHDELMKLGGTYAELFALQAESYK